MQHSIYKHLYSSLKLYAYIGGYMYVSKFFCHTIHKHIRLNYVIEINKLYVCNF